MLKAIGVIPARWASTRLPGKSLVALCGRPLIQWVLESVRDASRLDSVIVATDDERIAEAARACGADAVMTRADHPSGTDRVAEAAAGQGADIVVNIQGDEPLIDPALVDRLVDTLADAPAWDMATAAAPVNSSDDLEDPAVVKVVFDARRRALYFSRWPIPFVRDPDDPAPPGLHWRHIGVYAYRQAFLERLVAEPPCALEQAERLEQLRALHLGAQIAVVETERASIGVDTPEDVPYAEEALRASGRV